MKKNGVGRKRDIKEIDEIVRRLGLSNDHRELLHDDIRLFDLSFKEIVGRAEDVLQDYPGKRDKRRRDKRK